jgi:hypothetical protein
VNPPMRPLQLSMTGAAGVYLGAFVKNINAFAAAFPYCLAKSSSVSKCSTALAGLKTLEMPSRLLLNLLDALSGLLTLI